MGKQRVIAETGAGQHGVATATACALFGLDCKVFMGAVDVERQALNVWRMQLLGAEVVPVQSGSRTLKDAVNDALRDWVASVESTHYCLGSVVGPHPFPWIVREFQRVVGDEARAQCRAILGARPRRTSSPVSAAGRTRSARSPASSTPRRASSASRPVASGSRAASTVPRWPGASPASSTVRGRCTSRTRTARSSRPTPSRPGSTTRASAPSTPPSRRSGGPSTCRPRTTSRSRGSSSCRSPRGSSPRSNRPTRSAGWPGPRANEIPAGSTVLVTLSGRGDKDAAQVAEILRQRDAA